jgi:hypothetical protein
MKKLDFKLNTEGSLEINEEQSKPYSLVMGKQGDRERARYSKLTGDSKTQSRNLRNF